MPAATIVLPLAESFGLGTLGVTAGGIGAAVTGLEAGTVVASTVGGAIIGAGTGALNAAIQGGDIAKGATTGALTGGVGQGVGQAVGSQLTKSLTGDYAVPAGVQGPSAPSIAGSVPLGETAIQTLTPAATSLATSLVSGQPLGTALKSAALGGLGGLITSGAEYGFNAPQDLAKTAGQLGSQAAGYITATPPSYPTYQAPPSPGFSGTGPSPSPTLGQSLSIAPSLGYSPGSTVFGSSDDSQPKSKVWNVASLRNVGEEA